MSLQEAINSLVGSTDWKAYCISLPTAHERRENFSKWATSVNLSFEFFDAIDKHTIPASDIIVKSGTIPTSGETACRKSHEALYRKMLSESYSHYFLFEDDAGFKDTMTLDALLEFIHAVQTSRIRWSIVQFGYHSASMYPLTLMRSTYNKLLFSYEYADQCHAMFMKKDTIQKLLDLCQVEKYKTLPIDWITGMYQKKKLGITLGPEKSLIGQTDVKSFIWS